MTKTSAAAPARAGSAGGNLRAEPTALPVRRFGIGHELFGWHPVATPMPAHPAPPPPEGIDFDSMTMADAMAALGKTASAAKRWLADAGFRCSDGRVRKVRLAHEVQDEIAARIAAAPPSAPCFRCGARAGCEHRPTTHHEGARQHG